MRFILLNKEQKNYSECSGFASSALLQQFFTSNFVVFVAGGHKGISCPRAQGTLATPQPFWRRHTVLFLPGKNLIFTIN